MQVLGNTFVIVAFIVDKRLRNQSDFVLLNLTICDFLIDRSAARTRTKVHMLLCTLTLLRFCSEEKKPSSITHNDATLQHRNISHVNLSRDKKIAKSLSILVCVFVICWAPYTFLASIRAACSGYCVEFYMYVITTWILCMNSTINPILYPLFRKAFVLVVKKVNKFLKI
ncbi:hypothetical protein XELAEV_18031926mg [Xenopus laevis]|uniref:G-protein coupled receptors family 1 profile domain-containing protein n=1 Tax=Xenopus laevis TaxID=8355 RepID=A0A974CQA9_XENLA|nr:hypothetical protein XELAEV_18031926mg [Xenopus laevis]